MSYDTKCHELAEYFLEDSNPIAREKTVGRLAQTIQDTIEDFLNDAENFPPPEPMFDTGRERDEWRHEAAEQQRLK